MPETIQMEQRVTRLEGQMAEVREDVSEIKVQLKQTVTKNDLEAFQHHIDERDKVYTNNMWKLVFGLVGLLAALVVSAFGIRELPALFG